MNLIAKIQAWLALIPVIVSAVRALEEALPENGIGPTKLALIRMAVQSAYEGVSDVLGAFEHVWPRIETLVTNLVTALKAAKVFK